MNTALDSLLARLQTAGSPADSALAVADFACSKSPELARALAIAAMPHWFTVESLSALLDDDLKSRAAALHAAVIALPMVEEYPERRAHAIHDQTRLALRNRLLATDPGRFQQLSRRAAGLYGAADPTAADFVLTCEHLYHLLAGQTDAGDASLANVANSWLRASRIEPLQTLARLVDELLAAKPAPPLLARGQGLAYLYIADARMSHQASSISKSQLTQAEIIFRKLAGSDPANAGWQQNLSVSVEKLGNVAVAQGDLNAAKYYFSEGKTIHESLTVRDPANAKLQLGLSVSLEKLGYVAEQQGDLDAAKRCYTESKTIREHLTASDPVNAAWQRDLSVSIERLGNVAEAQGDLDAAKRCYTESKTIRERLAASDPANARWQRDLSVSFNKLGDIAEMQGNLDVANRCYTEGWTIRERLATGDSTNAGWQRDLSVSFNKLGDVSEMQGDLNSAKRSYTQSKTICERLAASDPANAEWQRDLWVSYWRLAAHCEKSNQAVEAQLWWRKAYDTLAMMKERGLHVSPKDLEYLEQLRAKVGQ